jgi:hypothetical protein
LNVRSIEIQFDAGRLDLAKLNPPGKVLGSATANMAGQPLTVNHVLISNDGTTVVTEFRANVGFVLAVADGEYTNVGADGVRLRISIRNPLPFPDGTTTGDAFSFGLPVGSIFVLPSQVGKTFNATTILTSVLWPGPGGTACSVQRKQSFITTP